MAKSKSGKGFPKDSNFTDVVTQNYFVDKSMLIKKLIDNDDDAVARLFTRPRRFGKSLNISMIQTFFEKTDEDTSIYFKDLKIWKCGEKYTSEQGKYPVIYLNLKEVNKSTFEKSLEKLKTRLSAEFSRHNELQTSGLVDTRTDLSIYNKIVDTIADEEVLEDSLWVLSRMLYAHYGVKPVILIDEYDVPIQTGYEHGYYAEITEFIRNLLSAALKDNKNISFAVITGAMRIAKESIFSGLNNLAVYSVMSEEFSEFFGFTRDEVKKILEDFGHPEKIDEICEWYDGYLFGETEIFNPWSVAWYITNDFKPGPYWVDTSGNTVIHDLLKNPGENDERILRDLVNDTPVTFKVTEYISYGDLYAEDESDRRRSIYSVMLATGYLTPKHDVYGDQSYFIPNKEIREIYSGEILNHIMGDEYPNTKNKIIRAMENGSAEMLENAISEYFLVSPSSLDFINENSYHNFMNGVNVAINGSFRVRSNEEAGRGRFDISYEPRNLSGAYPGVIMEFKVADDESDKENKIREAIDQTKMNVYEAKLKDAGVKKIDTYAVVFYKKTVKVVKRI
ncbi:MAG: ATP-binding protein [Clostridia bacterium]|nr:ATP-binding protein [Clostridia bacterium]